MLPKINKEVLSLYLGRLFLIIIALLPFHAFFTTWIISNFGNPDLVKSWKEILLFGVMVPIAALLLINDKVAYKKILSRKVNWLVVLFILINIVYALIIHGTFRQNIAGLLFNLRFFAIFLVAQIIIETSGKTNLIKTVTKIIFFTGSVVVIFGTLQVLFLPVDWLRHFGYVLNTIPPYLTVDNNIHTVRILSTLRGPNILGEYLILWLPLLTLVTLKRWNSSIKHKLFIVLLWLCGLVALFGTRSRGAWFGVCVSMIIMIFMVVKNKRIFSLVIGSAVLICTLLIVCNINSGTVQGLILHHDIKSTETIDSNVQHVDSLQNAINQIDHKPLGSGVGSAGLASTYGNRPNIIENYYLQISAEMGMFAGLLFVAITIMTIMQLYKNRKNLLVIVLLSSFIGLAIVNLSMPGWGDETVSMTWWGLAGLFMFNIPRFKKSPKRKFIS